jgi:hypothetical protein
MEIKLKTLNADGSIQFDGTLNQEQAQFILSIGLNYLLTQGAATFLEDNEDDDEDDFVVAGNTTVQ